MYIKSITLNNFRAYKGVNTTTFKLNEKNLFLIAGDNGFGKTTFLTSLVWCLYGKMMVDVDDKFRREINDAQGYKNYARLNLNRESASAVLPRKDDVAFVKLISKEGYSGSWKKLKSDSQYSVSIHLSNIVIPSIPCEDIVVTRTYDFLTDTETTEVLIDKQVNELAREVGYDIFINDFILSKDIAKFFFFDAEKIVSLAEIRSIDEKRKLSIAYSEVLGIKKYEDIKRNLENLRIKLRRRSANVVDKARILKMAEEIEELQAEISRIGLEIEDNETTIESLKSEINECQELLLREGNAMSIEDLSKQKELLSKLKEKDKEIKSKLRDMLEVAPFAISGQLFVQLKEQVDNEAAVLNNIANNEATVAVLDKVQSELLRRLNNTELSDSQKVMLSNIISSSFTNNHEAALDINKDVKVLVEYSKTEINEFQALYDNIRYTFSQSFKQLVKDEKNNSIFLTKTTKKITDAEKSTDNAEINAIRQDKAIAEHRLIELYGINKVLLDKVEALSKDKLQKAKVLSDLDKKYVVNNRDAEKDEIAARLIGELTTFLNRLRIKKKISLEKKIKDAIDKLMHKSDFIHKVLIEVTDDIIDIVLLAVDGTVINKDRLSKGEQQLYATAILKALVDESGIEFPVFIDSPLQKFDSRHAKNIIEQFYPTVSKQVVIFPLLGKELSEEEYNALLPNVNSAYIIRNENNRSRFDSIAPSEMFNK